jgi:hypothetical protein
MALTNRKPTREKSEPNEVPVYLPVASPAHIDTVNLKLRKLYAQQNGRCGICRTQMNFIGTELEARQGNNPAFAMRQKIGVNRLAICYGCFASHQDALNQKVKRAAQNRRIGTALGVKAKTLLKARLIHEHLKKLLWQYKGKCYFCEKELTLSPGPNKVHRTYKSPRRIAGERGEDVASCEDCRKEKPLYWKAQELLNENRQSAPSDSDGNPCTVSFVDGVAHCISGDSPAERPRKTAIRKLGQIPSILI